MLWATVALPLLLMAAGAGLAWRNAWRDAVSDLEHTADAAAEYTQRVLSGYAVAAGRVDAMVRGLADEDIRALEAELHRELAALVAELPQAEAAFVLDRTGHPLVSANVFPIPRDAQGGRDRDFFTALSAPDAPAVHVSRVYVGRLDQALFFAISRRRTRTGNVDAAAGGFDGLVNLSAYPNRIAEGLRRLAGEPGDVVSILREDGDLLARSTGQPGPVHLPHDGAFAAFVAGGAERGLYEAPSPLDGIARLHAARRVEGWPVHVQAARSRAAILASWRDAVLAQLAIGVPATLALLALVIAVRRSQDRLAGANAGLEARVAERTAALAGSEARLHQALGAGRVFAIEWDAVSDRILRSPNAAGILGLPEETARRDTGARFLASVDPEDLPHLRAASARATPADPAYEVRFRVRGPGGVALWLHETGVARFGTDGRFLGLTSLARDVTAEAEAEAALRAGEVQRWELLATLDLGNSMVRDPDGTIRFWSRGLEALYGFAPEAAIGRVVHELLATRFPDTLAAMEAALERDGEWSGDLVHRRRDGREVVVAARMLLRRATEGGQAQVLEVVTDVTAQRAVEAAHARSEAMLRLATAAARVGLWETDLVSGERRWSPEACALVGLGADEPVGPDWLRLVHPDDRDRVRGAWRRTLKDGAPYDVEYRTACRAPDGGERWLVSRGRVERDSAGRALRGAGVIFDVTARRRAEERLILLAREVDHRAKNALSVVQAAVRLSPRDDAAAFATAVEGRVAALARAQVMLADAAWEGSDMRALAEGALAAFAPGTLPDAPAVEIEGEPLRISAVATQPLSLALHELATNAAKHGALSRAGGRVVLSWQVDAASGMLVLRWRESGGPPVQEAPSRRGFGSRVLEATLRGQLGGRLDRSWDPDGLSCTIELPARRVLADPPETPAAA